MLWDFTMGGMMKKNDRYKDLPFFLLMTGYCG